jgi:hypothetical protein
LPFGSVSISASERASRSVGDAAAGGVALLLDLGQRAIELDLPLAQFVEHRRNGAPRC